MWSDTWALLRRESLSWFVWSVGFSSLLYSFLAVFQQARGREACGGVRQEGTAWLMLVECLMASLSALVLAQTCRRSAARERLFRYAAAERRRLRAQASESGASEAELAAPLLAEETGDAEAESDGEGDEEVDEAKSSAVRKGRLLIRLAKLSRPDYGKLAFAFLFLVLAVVGDVAIPAFKAEALSAILERAGSASSGGELISPRFTRALVRLAVASLAAGVFAGFRGGLLSVCNVRLVRRLQQALFGRLIRLEFASLDAQATGKLLSRLTTDTALVGDVLGLNVNVAVRSLLRLLLTVAYLATLDVPLTLVSLSSALTFFGVSFFFSRYQRANSKAAQEATAESNHVAEQTLSLARTVRAFSAEGWEEARFESVLRDRQNTQERAAAAYTIYTIAFGVLDNAQSVFLMLSGGSLYASGRVSGDVLTTFVFYSGVVSASIQSVADMLADTFKALGASEEVFRLLDEPAPASELDTGEQPCADACCMPGGPQASAHVELTDVRFTYPSRPGVRVLDGVSFSLMPGQQVALVGASGSGKSTIVQLLLRYYDPDSGTIRFNGHDITQCSARWLRSMMSCVGQEPPLFSVSLRDNIAYASSAFTDAQVEHAAELACAASFINAMPEGYATLVGPMGVQLSGGQKQRVAIARAVLRQPPLLILDEATSALDATSERDVQAALESAARGRSVLVVAHRLSTVRSSDLIVVMRAGTVVETGTHDALVEARGAYYTLVSRQLGDQSAAVLDA